MPLTLPNKVATAVGPAIDLVMLGSQIAFTQYYPMFIESFDVQPKNQYQYLYPKLAQVDETTPVHIIARDSGTNWEQITLLGSSDVIFATSTPFPLGGTEDDIYYAMLEPSFLCVENEMGGIDSSGGSGYGSFPVGEQQILALEPQWSGTTLPDNPNTNAILTSTPFVRGPGFGCIVSFSEDGVPFRLEWDIYSLFLTIPPSPLGGIYTSAQAFKDADGRVYVPGNFQYDDFDPVDPVGVRNQWQAVRYTPGTGLWDCVALVDLGADTFPLPDPLAAFMLQAACADVLGDKVYLLSRLCPAGSQGTSEDQLIYVESTPNECYENSTRNDPDDFRTTAVIAANTTLSDVYTPVIDGVGVPDGYVLQGTPDGFLCYQADNPLTFYMVSRDWETYQEYNVYLGNQDACDIFADPVDAIVKWVRPGDFILLADLHDGGAPIRLRVGVPSGGWMGCDGMTPPPTPPGPPPPPPPPPGGGVYDPTIQAHTSINVTLNQSSIDGLLFDPETEE